MKKWTDGGFSKQTERLFCTTFKAKYVLSRDKKKKKHWTQLLGWTYLKICWSIWNRYTKTAENSREVEQSRHLLHQLTWSGAVTPPPPSTPQTVLRQTPCRPPPSSVLFGEATVRPRNGMTIFWETAESLLALHMKVFVLFTACRRNTLTLKIDPRYTNPVKLFLLYHGSRCRVFRTWLSIKILRFLCWSEKFTSWLILFGKCCSGR